MVLERAMVKVDPRSQARVPRADGTGGVSFGEESGECGVGPVQREQWARAA